MSQNEIPTCAISNNRSPTIIYDDKHLGFRLARRVLAALDRGTHEHLLFLMNPDKESLHVYILTRAWIAHPLRTKAMLQSLMKTAMLEPDKVLPYYKKLFRVSMKYIPEGASDSAVNLVNLRKW